MPSWSNLRKQLRQRVTASLRDRVDFHYTLYEGKRGYHKQPARGQVLENGSVRQKATRRPNYSWREVKHWSFWVTVDSKEVLRLGCCGPYLDPENEAGPDHAIDALKQYLNLPISEALLSTDVMIRGIALLDARVGARRLSKIKPAPDAHDFNRLCYQLRTTIHDR